MEWPLFVLCSVSGLDWIPRPLVTNPMLKPVPKMAEWRREKDQVSEKSVAPESGIPEVHFKAGLNSYEMISSLLNIEVL